MQHLHIILFHHRQNSKKDGIPPIYFQFNVHFKFCSNNITYKCFSSTRKGQ
uniref:Uncharacterized protein n=1 Tax=Rhizophora mucronata TaxID=61149 RepID=A0A2P2J9J4_RHIMU